MAAMKADTKTDMAIVKTDIRSLRTDIEIVRRDTASLVAFAQLAATHNKTKTVMLTGVTLSAVLGCATKLFWDTPVKKQ